MSYLLPAHEALLIGLHLNRADASLAEQENGIVLLRRVRHWMDAGWGDMKTYVEVPGSVVKSIAHLIVVDIIKAVHTRYNAEVAAVTSGAHTED